MDSTETPNIPDNNGRTPIHWASENGHLEIIKLLMTSSDDLTNARDNNGWTPLDVAKDYWPTLNLIRK